VARYGADSAADVYNDAMLLRLVQRIAAADTVRRVLCSALRCVCQSACLRAWHTQADDAHALARSLRRRCARQLAVPQRRMFNAGALQVV
jgi:hypothetical protein